MIAVTGPIYAGLGGDPFSDWSASIRALVPNPLNGGPTTWPFKAGIYGKYFGRPAARFDIATYVRLGNTGKIARTGVQQITDSGQWAYVLAPDAAASAAPHVMTTTERLTTEALVRGDQVADALHLPSLADLENALKSIGRDALIVLAVGGVAWYLVRRR